MTEELNELLLRLLSSVEESGEFPVTADTHKSEVCEPTHIRVPRELSE